MQLLADHIRLFQKIGSGSYADVYSGKDTNTEDPVCVKKVSRRVYSVECERQAGTRLNHPAIPKLLGYYRADGHHWLIFELVDGVDLYELMERRNLEPMIESDAGMIFRQLAEAVNYCHGEGIAHRDLKLENVMIDKKTQTVKLIDFGLCSWEDPTSCYDCVGSVNYCAPEVYSRSGPYNSFLSDVFSLGVILYAILYARFPYAVLSSHSLELDLMKPISWTPFHSMYEVSKEAISLLKLMLAINPLRRIDMKKVLQHPWVQSCSPHTSGFPLP